MVRYSLTFVAVAVALLAASSIALPVEAPDVHERDIFRDKSPIRKRPGFRRSVVDGVEFEERDVGDPAKPTNIAKRRGRRIPRSLIYDDDLEERALGGVLSKIKAAARRRNRRSLIDGDDLEKRSPASRIISPLKKAKGYPRSLTDSDDLEARGNAAKYLVGGVKKLFGGRSVDEDFFERSLIDGEELEERGLRSSRSGAMSSGTVGKKKALGGRSVDEDLFDRELEIEWE